MNKTVKYLVIASAVFWAAVLVLIIVGVATFNEEPTTKKDEAIQVKVEQDFKERYSDSVTPREQQAFMDACAEDSTMRAYCQCTFNYLDSRLTPNEFRSLGENLDNEIPEVFWSAFESCAYKL